MAQNSIYYAIGRIAVIQKNALDGAKLERLIQAPSVRDAARVLAEYGWPDQEDYEKSANEHVQKAIALVRKIIPDQQTVDCFLYHYDVSNLKLLLKARSVGTETERLSECGTVPPEDLRRAVADRDYSKLAPTLREALEALEKRLSVKVDPFDIDVTMDRALYKLIFVTLPKREKTVISYFKARVDILNCIMTLRALHSGKPSSFLRSLLIENGSIPTETWLKKYAEPEKLPQLMQPYGGKLLSAVIAAQLDPKKLSALERSMDDYLLSLYTPFRRSIERNERVIGYLFLREREAAAVRLLMAGKANGFPPEAVRERLRTLYA